jgi:hypothetical protein
MNNFIVIEMLLTLLRKFENVINSILKFTSYNLVNMSFMSYYNDALSVDQFKFLDLHLLIILVILCTVPEILPKMVNLHL